MTDNNKGRANAGLGAVTGLLVLTDPSQLRVSAEQHPISQGEIQ